jgi:hypothetical protein
MVLSRRTLLSWLALLPTLAGRKARAATGGRADEDGSKLVLVRGWVLRRDDLARLTDS